LTAIPDRNSAAPEAPLTPLPQAFRLLLAGRMIRRSNSAARRSASSANTPNARLRIRPSLRHVRSCCEHTNVCNRDYVVSRKAVALARSGARNFFSHGGRSLLEVLSRSRLLGAIAAVAGTSVTRPTIALAQAPVAVKMGSGNVEADAQVFYAIDRGFFEKNGIDAKLSIVRSGNTVSPSPTADSSIKSLADLAGENARRHFAAERRSGCVRIILGAERRPALERRVRRARTLGDG
jgi:hypothetical protein